MKEINIESKIYFGQLAEFSKEDQELIAYAIEALDNYYAKYSNFNVGAAIRLSDGKIIKGANQENASFPAGLCAERTAIFAAQAQYPDLSITALAVAARNCSGILNKPITPCGICRQTIQEIESRYHKPVRILLYGKDGVYALDGINKLLPLSFIGDDL